MQRSLRARQWGKAGPIMALVSILIIAALAKVTLGQFGLTQEAAAKAATPVTANAKEVEGDGEDAVAQTSPPKGAPAQPASSLDKARAVQGLVDRHASKSESQIESEGK